MIQIQNSFWDVEARLTELSAEGNSLEKLANTFDFVAFRRVLRMTLVRSAGGKVGYPALI